MQVMQVIQVLTPPPPFPQLKPSGSETCADAVIVNGTTSTRYCKTRLMLFCGLKILNFPLFYMKRTKSTSELDDSEVSKAANPNKIQCGFWPVLIHPELSDLTRKNWTYLTNEVSNL